jgi:hypothetical protein
MPFQVGNTYGGKRKNSGRPPKIKKEIQKAAAEIAREYINRSVKPVMATYFQLAHGRIVNKWHEGKIVGEEFEADAATTRHFVDKILPDEQDKQSPTGNTIIQFIIGTERRNDHAGLPQEGQRRDVDSGAICFVGDEGGSGRNGSSGHSG